MRKPLRVGLVAISLLFVAACAVTPPPIVTPQPVPLQQVHVTVWRDGAQFTPDGGALTLDARAPIEGTVQDQRLYFILPVDAAYGWHARISVRYEGGTTVLDLPALAADLDVTLPRSGPGPIPSKAEFVRNYQGNFGSIKLPGCGLPFDSLFDPFLLTMWTFNRGCYEQMMQAHADRNDNRIVVDPRADYHGQLPTVDLYHDPATWAAFITDVRSHRNAQGEPFEVLAFFSADEHIASFIDGRTGRRDLNAEDHWRRDVGALLDVVGPQLGGVTPCWECRHQRDYMHPDTFAMMGQFLHDRVPAAWMGVHLIVNSSSISSWNCGDTSNPACNAEPDDRFLGNEPGFWTTCRKEGWCDGLMFQFDTGSVYTNPDAYPNYTPGPGALGRWWEIVVRLANDPWAAATAGGDRHGWVQADVLAFEHIYDAYNNRSTEAYGIEFCKRALQFGGWGCGSASYRRPK